MKLISYKAKCGDAFHIQYVGRSGCRRNILLDMGYSKTYTDVLKRIISDIADSGEKIDTLFLSHIHNDHIGGASKFIRDIESGTVPCNIVAHWIYNADTTPIQRQISCNNQNDKKSRVNTNIYSI